MRTLFSRLAIAALLAMLTVPVFGQEKPSDEKDEKAQAEAAQAEKLKAAEKELIQKLQEEKAKERAKAEQARLKTLIIQLEQAAEAQQFAGKASTGSKFWIGVGCSEVPPVLSAQLSLPEEQGLVVDHVAPDSPAAKAGLALYDVILEVGDKKVGELQDLIDAIQAVEGKETPVKVIRKGKEQTLKLTPAERPRVPQDVLIDNPQGIAIKGEAIHVLQPGLVFKLAEAPKDLSIVIQRPEKEQKSKIVVKQDGKTFEVTEDELDKLPQPLRDRVRILLAPVHPAMPHPHIVTTPLAPGAPAPFVPARVRAFMHPEHVDKQLKEINDKLDRLQKAVEALTNQKSGGDKDK